MKWKIEYGDILDIEADALISSANVLLNMSGGVGGAILTRYGDAMQRELREYLATQGLVVVKPGCVVETSPAGTPFSYVFHAVAIDVFYCTSHELILTTIRTALTKCAERRCKTVALTALATGYGRYAISDFSQVIRELHAESFPPVEMVTVCVKNQFDADELKDALYHV